MCIIYLVDLKHSDPDWGWSGRQDNGRVAKLRGVRAWKSLGEQRMYGVMLGPEHLKPEAVANLETAVEARA